VELILYFLFVAFAIGGVALLLNALGRGKSAVYTEEEARQHLLSSHPEETPSDGFNANGTILFRLDGNRVAIIRAMGQYPLIELINEADLRLIESKAGALVLQTRDFADPEIRLQTRDPEALKVWIDEAFAPGPAAD